MGKVYDSGAITSNWNGIDLSKGFEGITKSMNGGLKSYKWDLKGERTTSRLANQGGTIEFTFTQTADVVEDLDKYIAGEQLLSEFVTIPYEGLLFFEDKTKSTGNFVALGASLESTGDEEWAEEVGSRTFMFNCSKIIMGNVPDILANLAQYYNDSNI